MMLKDELLDLVNGRSSKESNMPSFCRCDLGALVLPFNSTINLVSADPELMTWQHLSLLGLLDNR
jgi:hypothetical protein